MQQEPEQERDKELVEQLGTEKHMDVVSKVVVVADYVSAADIAAVDDVADSLSDLVESMSFLNNQLIQLIFN